MIGASISPTRETYLNMTDEILRSIASAVSQAVQRTVDEALSRLPTSGASSSYPKKSPVLHTFSFYSLRDFVDDCEIDALHVHVHAYRLTLCSDTLFVFKTRRVSRQM